MLIKAPQHPGQTELWRRSCVCWHLERLRLIKWNKTWIHFISTWCHETASRKQETFSTSPPPPGLWRGRLALAFPSYDEGALWFYMIWTDMLTAAPMKYGSTIERGELFLNTSTPPSHACTVLPVFAVPGWGEATLDAYWINWVVQVCFCRHRGYLTGKWQTSSLQPPEHG